MDTGAPSGLGFVLVHGGGMTSTMWDPILPLLSQPAVTVDLPGRRYHPADLARVTTSDQAAAIASAAEASGFERVVVVGHSSAGFSMPYLPARLPTLTHLVFVSCTVAARGWRPVDFLRDDIKELTMNSRDAQLERSRGRTVGGLRTGEPAISTDLEVVENSREAPPYEAPLPLFETAEWPVLPAEIGRTYVIGLRDRVIPPDLARSMAACLDPVDLVEVPGGHNPVSDPAPLAEILTTVVAKL